MLSRDPARLERRRLELDAGCPAGTPPKDRAPLCSPGVNTDELYDAEHALLRALQRRDFDAVTLLLADDFLITTAGWIAEPANKPTWLAGFGEHQLDEFELRLLATRRYDHVAESAQKGSRSGEPWEHTFRYTDVWLSGSKGVAPFRPSRIDRPSRVNRQAGD